MGISILAIAKAGKEGRLIEFVIIREKPRYFRPALKGIRQDWKKNSDRTYLSDLIITKNN